MNQFVIKVVKDNYHSLYANEVLGITYRIGATYRRPSYAAMYCYTLKDLLNDDLAEYTAGRRLLLCYASGRVMKYNSLTLGALSEVYSFEELKVVRCYNAAPVECFCATVLTPVMELEYDESCILREYYAKIKRQKKKLTLEGIKGAL